MTYEDLEEKRAERAVTDAKAAEKKAKKAAKEAKRVASAGSKAEGAATGLKKRGRKRKSASLEQTASNPAQKAKVLRTSETRVEEIEIIQQLYRAPEAKMY